MASWPLTWVSKHWQRADNQGLLQHRRLQGLPLAQQTIGQNPFQARPLQEALPPLHLPLACTQTGSEKKRRKRRDCLHKASHSSRADWLKGLLSLAIFPSGRWSSKRQEGNPRSRRKRRIRNRIVYNDSGLSGFVQMLAYKCLRFGKELYIISERDTTRMCHACNRKQDMPLWMRTYRCANCGLVMDRDENSAVNIYQAVRCRACATHVSDLTCDIMHERAGITMLKDVLKGRLMRCDAQKSFVPSARQATARKCSRRLREGGPECRSPELFAWHVRRTCHHDQTHSAHLCTSRLRSGCYARPAGYKEFARAHCRTVNPSGWSMARS